MSTFKTVAIVSESEVRDLEALKAKISEKFPEVKYEYSVRNEGTKYEEKAIHIKTPSTFNSIYIITTLVVLEVQSNSWKKGFQEGMIDTRIKTEG